MNNECCYVHFILIENIKNARCMIAPLPMWSRPTLILVHPGPSPAPCLHAQASEERNSSKPSPMANPHLHPLFILLSFREAPFIVHKTWPYPVIYFLFLSKTSMMISTSTFSLYLCRLREGTSSGQWWVESGSQSGTVVEFPTGMHLPDSLLDNYTHVHVHMPIVCTFRQWILMITI